MQYKLASSTWGVEEREAVLRVLNSNLTTMGAEVRTFEAEFARYVKSKFAVMVNSGSSANLLAIAALIYKRDKPLRAGQEIIVPSVSWGTTYYPVSQHGLTLRFVDVDPNTLCIDVNEVLKAVNKNTGAIFAVNLLGQAAELDKLRSIAQDMGIYLIEDNCESLGATLDSKQCGTWGLMGTFSTFFSHHISTMEGGLVVTDDEELRDILISLRAHGWTRELGVKNQVFTKTGDDWEDRFRFVLPGYNLRPLEMEGAIGTAQIKKFPDFLEKRRANHKIFQEIFGQFPDIRLQHGLGESSSFGFSLILEGKLNGKRRSLINFLEEVEIETRPIVSGNFALQPVIKRMKTLIPPKMPVADEIHDNGFFLGNHHFDLRDEIEYSAEVFDRWAKSV